MSAMGQPETGKDAWERILRQPETGWHFVPSLPFKAGHRLRDEPYDDELDQQFCEPCGTLCREGRPCECCWVDHLDEIEGAE